MNRSSSNGKYVPAAELKVNRVLNTSAQTGHTANEMRKIGRILVPTDFSRASESGARYALSVARELGAELIVYHVITLNSIKAFGRSTEERVLIYDRPNGLVDACLLRLRLFVERILADTGVVGKGIRVREKAEFGIPWRNIVRAAAVEKADLIVMSMRRKSTWERLLSSNVTEKVRQDAPCPLLTVPAEFSSATHESVYKRAA
jgi:nucleotide-binding universal stress UspA family protein